MVDVLLLALETLPDAIYYTLALVNINVSLTVLMEYSDINKEQSSSVMPPTLESLES